MSRYQKGRRAEIRAKKELEEAGFVVTRAAGSKGVADLVATKVLYVQVKAVKEPHGWTNELEEMRDGLPSGPGIVKQLWVWPNGGPWEKHEVGDAIGLDSAEGHRQAEDPGSIPGISIEVSDE